MSTIGQSSADQYITSVLYITGLWFDKNPTLSYRIHSFFVIFILMLSWVLALDIGLVLSDNIARAAHALCTCLPVTVFYAKAMNLYVNNEKIQDCLKRIQNFKLNDVEEERLANRRLSVFFKLVLFYAFICNLTITLVCWRVVFLTEPELPFTAWYPLDWQHNNRDFWIAQSIQFYGMAVAVNINLTCELFPCFFLTMIGCQLDILGMRLEKLNDSHPQDEKVVESAIDKHIESTIDEHIETHHYILELIQDVQESYDFPFFVEICTVGLTITANGYQLAHLVALSREGEHDIPEYAHYITYGACTVVRIFMPCFFGNLVFATSDVLTFRIYSSDWLAMSVLCRKKLIILMERMKRPTIIWAWVLFPLTLPIFKTIINFSYTMLTLLQNLN